MKYRIPEYDFIRATATRSVCFMMSVFLLSFWFTNCSSLDLKAEDSTQSTVSAEQTTNSPASAGWTEAGEAFTTAARDR